MIDLEVGDRVCRPDGGEWATKSRRAIIIVTSATCPSCQQNRVFEEHLYRECRRARIPIFYILAESPEQRARASELRSEGRNVLQTNLAALGFTRTPTIAAVDRRGVILAMWVGNVPARQQEEILGNLASGVGGQLCERIRRADLKSRATSAAPRQILALAEPSSRSLFPGIRYQVIPLDEIGVRAQYELNPEIVTFVDCSTARSPWDCQEALLTLKVLGFRRLIAVDLPRRPFAGGCGT
jgi:thioredoxin-related protein